ncbi:UNVERIFIED_CONTAM: hypothetical protein Scaly_1663800 [Sesamum calycinum]|uniref:Reverse transcriptase zinc-binding domain-containing protein n=1 Tax=Sesamum calycinum TaxID=2727403 RepID=A0AAW2NUI8_9LAMI
MSLSVYWAMAFILPKGSSTRLRKRFECSCGKETHQWDIRRWHVMLFVDRKRKGDKESVILALNKSLMSRHLWNVIQNNQSSIWVKWIVHTRLRHKSVWTVDEKGGSWGWRKLIRLRYALLPYIEFKIGDGESFSLWHDPWHSLDPLISRFSRGPGLTNTSVSAKLSLRYSRQCLREMKETVRFSWPNHAWGLDITWASRTWNGRHIVQAAYRSLLAAIVYNIWQERNRKIFQHIERPSSTVARMAVDEIRQKIISIDLPDSISSQGLYRLWRIPWPVRDNA